VTSAPAESVLGFFGQLRQRGLLRLLGPLQVVIDPLRALMPDDPHPDPRVDTVGHVRGSEAAAHIVANRSYFV